MKYLLSLKIYMKFKYSAIIRIVIVASVISALTNFYFINPILYFSELYYYAIQLVVFIFFSTIIFFLTAYFIWYSTSVRIDKINKKLSFFNDQKSFEIAQTFLNEGVSYCSTIVANESSDSEIQKIQNTFKNSYSSHYYKSIIPLILIFITIFIFFFIISRLTALSIWDPYYGLIAAFEILIKMFIPYLISTIYLKNDYLSALNKPLNVLSRKITY